MVKTYFFRLLAVLFLANFPWVNAPAATAQQGPPPAVVAVAKAQLKPWQQEISATGTLSARQGVMLRPEIAGRVTKIFFKSGQWVQAGAPLLELNPEILQAQVHHAHAQAQLSAGDLSRGQALYQRGVIAKAELDRLRATARANKANLAQMQAQLNQALIRAPFSGRIGLNLVNIGDYLNVGQAIANLQDTAVLRVDFSVPEADLKQLALGQTVLVYAPGMNTPYQGKVYAFDSAINPDNRSLALRATVPNPQQKLVPGSFVAVTLLVGDKQELVTVPLTALVNTAEGTYVFRVANNRVIKTAVVLGTRNATEVAVRKGLAVGEMVITAGQLKVENGAPVIAQPGE